MARQGWRELFSGGNAAVSIVLAGAVVLHGFFMFLTATVLPSVLDGTALTNTATVGWLDGTEPATSLSPRDGSFLLPVNLAVQKAEGVGLGDRVVVVMRVGRPGAR